MEGANPRALRVTLAVPLAFEAYTLVLPAFRDPDWRPLSYLVFAVIQGLPAVVFAAACLCVLLGRSPRWLWLALAASGVWRIFLDLYLSRAVALPWRPSVDFVIGLYAVLLAVAFLLAASPKPRHTPPRERARAGGTIEP